MKVDLHTHTTASDGTQTPAELLARAQKEGIEILSITDHISVGAYTDLKPPKGMKIINGVEIYFQHGAMMNEVLGYGIDVDKIKPFLAGIIQQRQEDELENLAGIYEMCKTLGFKMSSFDALRRSLCDGNVRAGKIIQQDIYSYPENKPLGIKYDLHWYHFYDNVLNNPQNKLFYESINTYPTLESASKAIRDAGGLCVMAHIFKLPENDGKKVLEYAVKNKLLDGVEVYHKLHNKVQEKYLLDFAQKHSLLTSGGTDNHYPNEPLGITAHLSILDSFKTSNLGKTLSIIVPIYKVEQYLCKCVDSIVDSLVGFEERYEIILVDDGSPDNCPKVCDDYARKHENIFVVHKENGGLSDARNFGIQNAKGEFLIFIDSDDFVNKNIAKLFDLIDKNQDIKIFETRYEQCDKDDKTFNVGKYKYKSEGIKYSRNKHDMKQICLFTSANTKVIRRDFIIDNNLFFKKGRLCEDVDWSARVWALCDKIYVTNLTYYFYVFGVSASIMTSYSLKNVNSVFLCITENWSKNKMLNRFLAGHVFTTVLYSTRKFNKRDLYEYIKILRAHKRYLKYPFNMKTRIFYICTKLIGIKYSVKLLARITSKS